MSQSPDQEVAIDREHPYAQAARQLNQLVRLGHSFSGNERNCCFLNVGGGRFANVSTISGLDFPDDGRAVVRSDWDHDGDLDFWVANRTAPQVRFLRNDLATRHHFLRFRLVGTASNRDAIGARVAVALPSESNGAGSSGAQLSQSVRAGEGFLAQSSKWIHFGLGSAEKIERLEVRWPAGRVEEFPVPVEVDRHYELVEGTGVVEEWTPPATSGPPNKTNHSEPVAIAANTSSQHFLSQAAPLPPLGFSPFAGAADNGTNVFTEDATRPTGHPVLLNLWATWCAPCLVELREFVERSEEIEEHKLRIVALSVDGASAPRAEGEMTPQELLRRLEFPHTAGLASPELLDRLQLVNNMIYRDDHRRLPVPTSLLIDGQGRLAAIYKGPVSVDRVLRDVERLKTFSWDRQFKRDAAVVSAADRLEASLPFAGRWLAPPGPLDTVRLASELWDHGFGADAIELANRLPLPEYQQQRIDMRWLNAVRLRSAGNPTDALGQLLAVLELAPDHAETQMEVGTILAARGEVNAALEHLQRAANGFDPPRADALANLAMAFRRIGQLDAAEINFREALAIDANLAPAHAGLGMVQAAQQRFTEAAASFVRAAALEPDSVQHRLNLATAWMSAGEPQRALAPLEDALRLAPESIVVLTYSGQVLAEVGQLDAATNRLTRVVALQPDAAKVWFRLAELHEQQGDLDAALQHYREAARLAPGDETVESRIDRVLAAVQDNNASD